MNRLLKGCWVSVGAAALAVASATPAMADDTVVVTSPTPTVHTAEPAAAWPNAYLLHSGVVTLGVSYVPALIVAIESDNPADDHLYAPIVGPWLDLANRDDCEGDCNRETVNKVLLVTDGVFQGLGALQILGSFILPQGSQTVRVSNSDGSTAVAFQVAPANFGRGANGLMAVGEF